VIKQSGQGDLLLSLHITWFLFPHISVVSNIDSISFQDCVGMSGLITIQNFFLCLFKLNVWLVGCSFHAFWRGIDQNTRWHMSRDKIDAVLKVVVKHFFIEKEVLSTLVMDSLYSGLRALESQSKIKTLKASPLEKEIPAPIISIENDMFVLADDVFLLLERASLESSHPPLPSKEEKVLPTRVKVRSGPFKLYH